MRLRTVPILMPRVRRSPRRTALEVAQHDGGAEVRRQRVERGLHVVVEVGVVVVLRRALARGRRAARRRPGSASKRMRARRRTRSRNRFVVIRCSQPSNVPGV
jgi:hypothetical protein